ncbi:MAG: hypothetical protein ACKO2G_06260 [Verrucomicrobiales bacterium]
MRAIALLITVATAFLSGACTSFDREGKKNLATLDTSSQPAALRPALQEVFGREGLRSGMPNANPMFFQGRATKGQHFAYKDFGDWDTVIVERVYVDLIPIPSGTRLQARAQIIANPDGAFEDSKYPLVGARKRYKRLLENAASIAAGGQPKQEQPSSPAALQNCTIPLPLEGR